MEATDAICGGDGVADLEPEPEPEPEPEVGEVESCKRLRTSDESSTEALEQVTDSSNADLADSHNNVCMTSQIRFFSYICFIFNHVQGHILGVVQVLRGTFSLTYESLLTHILLNHTVNSEK